LALRKIAQSVEVDHVPHDEPSSSPPRFSLVGERVHATASEAIAAISQ
jgi:hypothetical protein